MASNPAPSPEAVRLLTRSVCDEMLTNGRISTTGKGHDPHLVVKLLTPDGVPT